jgi:hypothetical protein
LLLSDPERARMLWRVYNLPDEAWDDILRMMSRPAKQYIVSECRIEL